MSFNSICHTRLMPIIMRLCAGCSHVTKLWDHLTLKMENKFYFFEPELLVDPENSDVYKFWKILACTNYGERNSTYVKACPTLCVM